MVVSLWVESALGIGEVFTWRAEARPRQGLGRDIERQVEAAGNAVRNNALLQTCVLVQQLSHVDVSVGAVAFARRKVAVDGRFTSSRPRVMASRANIETRLLVELHKCQGCSLSLR